MQKVRAGQDICRGLSSKSLLGRLALSAVICMSLQITAAARSQWEIQHPTLPPDQDGVYMPGQMPGGLHNGVPLQLSNNFWQGQHPGFANRVQPGVMLTGILENKLSSGKNKPGDIFAITLQDGYVQSGMQVIPQNSKIVGAVTAVASASTQRHGMPGNIQVSLQSLVLPDGTHLPFAGFIASNPNHKSKDAPKKRNLGFDMRDSGAAMGAMFSNYTNGMGYLVSKRLRGKDFTLDQGEAIPIRLNQQLVVPEAEVKPVQTAVAPNGMPMNQQGGMSPQMVPGLAGADTVGQYRTPRPNQPVPGLVGEADPFAVTVNPAVQSKSLSEMPEPF